MIWIGFYRADDEEARETAAKMRSGDQTYEETMARWAAKRSAFRENLPQGCRLISAYLCGQFTITPGHPMLDQRPNFMIVETDDIAHLQWIIRYCRGWLTFDFHPYVDYTQAFGA